MLDARGFITGMTSNWDVRRSCLNMQLFSGMFLHHFNRTLREKCPYSEILWFLFSRIWIEYGEIIRISPYSVRMRKNRDQKNYEYGHFLRSED